MQRLLLILLLSFIFIDAHGQSTTASLSGLVKDKSDNSNLSFVNVLLKLAKDSSFVMGTISDETGQFIFNNVLSNNYYIEFSYLGYEIKRTELYVGKLSDYLYVGTVFMQSSSSVLNEVVISKKKEEIDAKMEKKTFSVADNVSQNGGSVLQSMQNLPGISVQDGKVQIRGNDKVIILIDGKQTAITGFGNQSGLDNIPASAIDKIEIINNPSAAYDANGNAGIINIVMKKNKKEGFNGKVGLTTGLGALWVKKENLPGMSRQYQNTPKLNPSLALNYRKKKINLFLQVDNLYTHTLNKNDFVTRTYKDGSVINQQTKRNRNTNFFTSKTGIDWNITEHDLFTCSALFSSEKIIDNGQEPFFNSLYERQRLWQFVEDELKTTLISSIAYQHKYKQIGHTVDIGLNYSFHRENEKYFFDNYMPTFTGKDAFKLLSDEHVIDFNLDYRKPLKYGKFETGVKFRNRIIPTNMLFIPGLNSPLDKNAGGWATYKEIIPAVYGNYLFENKLFDAEIGLRVEYVDLKYKVNPNHSTYKSDGYQYMQPFPNVRLGYKMSENKKLTMYYNRRVDRPNEVDIRIFPKYDDAEIIKVGNPALKPQFTNSLEIGFKTNYKKGYFYAAFYQRFTSGTITRISSIVPNSTILYDVFQNAGKSFKSGIEIIYSRDVSKWWTSNINLNAYRNQINSFSVLNKYPIPVIYTSKTQEILSGNFKFNNIIHFPKQVDMQVSAIYLAPDIIPQGKILQRFSLDIGAKKPLQNGKGEIFMNASDILNTMVIKREIQGDGFKYTSSNYYETQVIRIGYNRKF